MALPVITAARQIRKHSPNSEAILVFKENRLVGCILCGDLTTKEQLLTALSEKSDGGELETTSAGLNVRELW